MSIYIPECNVGLKTNTGAIRLQTPTGALLKGANVGCVTAIWVQPPPCGTYDANLNFNFLSRNQGVTGGGDAYIRLDQAQTTMTARWRNGGADKIGTTGLSLTVSPGKTYLVMLIVTAANVHLVACEPGGTPLVSSIADSTLYAFNVTANFWDAVSAGIAGGGTATGHYGPVEEFCFWTGLFPESGGVPDSTLIQNIANGTQDLATVHSALTSGAKVCRYRMLTADDLSDSFGLQSALSANTTTDRVLMSWGPLRPIALKPAVGFTQVEQVTMATPGTLTGATAVIKTPGGTYSGISPAAIQARLVKEDRAVYSNWETVATPSGGSWPEGQFAVPKSYTAGWMEIQVRAVDGGGAQIGDIVGANGWTGTGFNLMTESQSQLVFMFDTGAGVAIASTVRLAATFFVSQVVTPRIVSSDNVIARVARGIRQFATEIDALFPRVPISINAVGVGGTSIEDFLDGGLYVGNWAALKSKLGVNRSYYLGMFGHGTIINSPTTASYEGQISAIIAKSTANFGAPMGVILCPTARYAGASTGGSYTAVNLVRTAMRDFVIHNPTIAVLGGSWATVKCDSSDVGPHPADNNVGQGRSGSYLAFALLGACRATKQRPLQIGTVTPSGTTIRLKMRPVNPITV